MSTRPLNSISSGICRQNTQFNMYSTTSKQQEGCQLSGQQHVNIITLFQFNSRILVENCVVGFCNNGMFLQFYELTCWLQLDL